MKILQINSIVNSGSTGRIAEDIGRVAISLGHSSYIAYGRSCNQSVSSTVRIGTDIDIYWHGIYTLFSDRHAFASKKATIQFIDYIAKLSPDVIGLHNLHGYYINIEILFDFLRESRIPVLWTLFDCWPITGHCTYFDDISCDKWLEDCSNCPKKNRYPASYGLNQSGRNYIDKRRLFTSLENVELVVHSLWLKQLVSRSFLKNIKLHCLPSGIDIDRFIPLSDDINLISRKYHLDNRLMILGVANIWDARKGLTDFIRLSELLDRNWQIVLVGLSSSQSSQLPDNIIGIPRTESIEELAALYSVARVFVNPTWQDNFPTTNLEALACGTPVVTYNTGGSPEAIDDKTGIVVKKGDVEGLYSAINQIEKADREEMRDRCRARALKYFDKRERYFDYINLFKSLHLKSC